MKDTNITPEQAKQAIEEEKKVRTQRCASRIADVLREENCRLDVGILVTAEKNVPQLQVVAI